MATIQYIDSDGDLTLIVGPIEKARFRVCRSTLRLASPVWAAMVAGRFAEANCDEVKLPADDPQALRVLLLIAHHHHRISQVPETVSIATLGMMAKLCDKYDLLPWAGYHIRRWAEAIRGSWPIENIFRDCLVYQHYTSFRKDEHIIWAVSWTWIAWVLKRLDVFESAFCMLLDMIEPIKLKSLGELPPGCTDFLNYHVRQRIEGLLDVAYDLIDAAKDSNTSVCLYDPIDVEPLTSKRCYLIRSGQAIKFFWDSELPISRSQRLDACSVTPSLRSMSDTCEELQFVGEEHDFGGFDHSNCYPEFERLRTYIHNLLVSSAPSIREEFSKFFT